MIYLKDLQLRRRRCGGGDKLIFLQLRSRIGAPQRGALCVYVTSCRSTRSNQETSQRLPPLETAPLPLCKERLGEKHKGFSCIARRKANTSGRRGKQKDFLSCGAGG